jgi:hypothetical protein
MTRDEIFGGESGGAETMAERLSKEAASHLKSGRPGLWLRVEADGLEIPVGDEFFKRVLQDPELTGNRESGWHAINPYESAVLRSGKISQGLEGAAPRIDILRSGAVVLDVPLESLHWKGPEREIWPYALIEYAVSTLRIAAASYEKAGATDAAVGVHLALIGLRGWTLTPGSPAVVGGFSRHRRVAYDLDDFVLDRPLVVDLAELRDNLVRVASRLVIPIYEGFGLREADLPPEIDVKAGRLTFPT